jgi:hypothetical protein
MGNSQREEIIMVSKENKSYLDETFLFLSGLGSDHGESHHSGIESSSISQPAGARARSVCSRTLIYPRWRNLTRIPLDRYPAAK